LTLFVLLYMLGWELFEPPWYTRM